VTIENGTETVTVKASLELLTDMQKGWSPPVRAIAYRNLDGSWEMAFVAPNPERRAQIDAIWPAGEIPYLPFIRP